MQIHLLYKHDLGLIGSSFAGAVAVSRGSGISLSFYLHSPYYFLPLCLAAEKPEK